MYADGRRCSGYVVRIEAYKADLAWTVRPQSGWSLNLRLRSHFHVFCSRKGNHAGLRRHDASTMKFYYDQLPEALRRIVDSASE